MLHFVVLLESVLGIQLLEAGLLDKTTAKRVTMIIAILAF